MGISPFHVSLNYPLKEAISEPMLAELFSPDIQNARSQINVCRSSFISQDFGFCGHSITLKFIYEGSMDMCKAKTEQATFHVLLRRGMLYRSFYPAPQLCSLFNQFSGAVEMSWAWTHVCVWLFCQHMFSSKLILYCTLLLQKRDVQANVLQNYFNNSHVWNFSLSLSYFSLQNHNTHAHV